MEAGTEESIQLPWWQKPMVILAHVYDGCPKIERDAAAMDRLVRWKRKAGFEVEHLNVNVSMFDGKGGEDSRAYWFKNFHGYQADWLKEYLPIARKHGLRVIVYFNCHWFKPDTFPADHYVLNADGKPKVIYGDGGEICCRGPFRAWAEKMAEDLGRYPIDGVFLDGPVKDACWCPHCRAAFQARCGTELPANPAACPQPLQAEYEAFLTDMPIGFTEAFARGLHKHNPDAVLYCNGGGIRQMEATRPWTQWVGIEGGFIGYEPLTGKLPFSAGLWTKRLEYRAKGRARVIFCDCGFKVYDCYMHPQGEIARMYAAAISNGASTWFAFNRSAEKSPGVQTVYRFNRFVHKHREALTNGASLAEAAIVESPLNQELAGAVQADSGDDVHKREALARRLAVPRHTQELQGVYAAFARSGYPVDVIDDELLLGGGLPARIKLLVLPGVSAVSDRLAEWLRRFVADGGRLLATFDTGLFDERSERRKDFALADVFGASVASDLLGPSGLDYLGVAARSALTAGLSQNLLPCPEYWWWVKPASSAKPLLYYHEKMPRRYAALPPISEHPAALLNRFGKGSVVFIPSAIGDLSLRYRFPDIRLLLRNAAHMLAKPPVLVEGGDEFVETTLRQAANGAVVAHMINWASGERPSSGAIPLGPLRVTVRLPRGTPRPRSVELAVADRKAAMTVRGNAVSFAIPRLAEYEMAVVR